MREVTKQLLHLKKVFNLLKPSDQANSASIKLANLPLELLEDNGTAVKYSEKPSTQSSIIYLETDIYWINDYYRSGDLKVVKIAAKDMLADIGTKPNLQDIFLMHRSRMMT